jgi:hypothetical protein
MMTQLRVTFFVVVSAWKMDFKQDMVLISGSRK